MAVLLMGMAESGLAQRYMIDVNDADSPVTEAGWTGLDAVHTGSNSFVTIDGIDFTILSADGARLRTSEGNPNPNALTGDFAFDDGAGQAIILTFGGAGALPAREWQVDVYSYDPGIDLGTQIVGYRTSGAETIVAEDVLAHPTDPAISFRFESDGVSAYDVFLRENSDFGRTRLNAVVLTVVPEPASVALLGLTLAGVAAVAGRRRK